MQESGRSKYDLVQITSFCRSFFADMTVKFRYEKMIETITEWETEKKVKARRQKEQKEVFLVNL